MSLIKLMYDSALRFHLKGFGIDAGPGGLTRTQLGEFVGLLLRACEEEDEHHLDEVRRFGT